eukprot:m.252162 g.252162  ORF g.252162 m.252162 type:complete len:365 (+) comp22657_c0_seq1:1543-2637(+)
MPAKSKRIVEGAERLVVCVTGFANLERVRIKFMLSQIGVEFSGPFRSSNHLLIAKSLTGLKCQKALEWHLPIVSFRWLEDTYRQWQIMPFYTGHFVYMPSAVTPAGDKDTVSGQAHVEHVYDWHTLVAWRYGTPPRLRICLSGFTKEKKQQLLAIVVALSAEVTDADKCHVLCMEQAKRTQKMAIGIMSAVCVVAPTWLEESRRAGAFVDPSLHPLLCAPADGEGAALYVALLLANKNPRSLFRGWRFHVTHGEQEVRMVGCGEFTHLKNVFFQILLFVIGGKKGTTPSLETLQPIIEFAGARVVSADEIVQPSDLPRIVVTNTKGMVQWPHFLQAGVRLHSADVVLVNVTRQTQDLQVGSLLK